MHQRHDRCHGKTPLETERYIDEDTQNRQYQRHDPLLSQLRTDLRTDHIDTAYFELTGTFEQFTHRITHIFAQ